jgi:hypothetical protein
MDQNARSRAVILVVLSLLFGLPIGANYALAQTGIFETGRSGAWTTSEGFLDGIPRTCHLDATHNHLNVWILSVGEDWSLVSLTGPNWAFAQTTPTRVFIRIGRERWGFTGEAKGEIVSFRIRNSGLEPFWNAFRFSTGGSIDVFAGNGGSWRLNLNGSNAAYTRYLDCLPRVRGSLRHFSPPHSQDHADSPGTIPKTGVDDWLLVPETDHPRRPGAIPKTAPQQRNFKSPF